MVANTMVATAEQLLHAFETLPDHEKSVFAHLIWRRLPPVDSGEITDEELCAAGDALSEILDGEDHSHGAGKYDPTADLVGSERSEIPDLATNPRHMDGVGG